MNSSYLKALPLYLLLIHGYPSTAQCATISSPVIYAAYADGPGGPRMVPAATFGGFVFSIGTGLSGGEIIVSLSGGESVLSSTMSATFTLNPDDLDDALYDKTWTLTLGGAYPSIGSQPLDELWKQVGPYGGQPIWWGATDNIKRYIKVKFEVLTTNGLAVDDNGGGGYRGLYGQIPEPSAFLLLSLAGTLAALRRSVSKCVQ